MDLNIISLDLQHFDAVKAILSVLGHKISPSGISLSVNFCEKGFSVERKNGGLAVAYSRKCELFRSLSFLKSVWETGKPIRQKASFSMLCYMDDVSRNSVMRPDAVRRMVRYLAMMGYDSLMLYMEDTYEIPEYPYFGHMRGRYTQAELRELDDYADSFGIELIPCIQTLAHLNTALRWECFSPYSDTPNILLADDDRTYALIDAMLASVSSCFRSRRIHLGMDEAHSLGLGKHLDLHGYESRFDILSRHLNRVNGLCEKYGLAPMIWSDMYFRICNHGEYYSKDLRIPEEILRSVPKNVSLVYWDYFHESEDLLRNMFENHLAFPGEMVFAGGAWKWCGIAPHNRMSWHRAAVHADACLRYGCNRVIVTGWGDDGSEASHFSTLPSLVMYAEKCYAPGCSVDAAGDRFATLFGMSVEDFFALDLPNDALGCPEGKVHCPSKYLLYNGVLGGLFDAHVPEESDVSCRNAADRLRSYCGNAEFGYIFATLASLCSLLEKKAALSMELRKAYLAGDKQLLLRYAGEEIPETIRRVDAFLEDFRRQWFLEGKTFGFEVQEVRLGGLKENLRSAALRLESYCAGEADRIEELEQPVLPYSAADDGSANPTFIMNCWTEIITANRY